MAFRAGWIDDPELGVRVLVLNDVGLSETLELQRAYRGPAGDQAPKDDVCCLVRNGAAVVYGGVETFDLSGARLTLTLTADAAATLELPLTVVYDLDSEGLALVRQRLREILT
ncbi:Immunity protein 10 [Microlunatus sagamiharensis]|uniref:Immunity protein 10 n=1 Tax=Microlunatus sagamiharensis TaxID=546874 RepID=A0A1H2MPN0_9ACTN|nr:Imm10 family immunity protein [Microlunatus sagamiharensis]SDU95207.1 Immunity protein 10 [Microlunatus sagamiharensis]